MCRVRGSRERRGGVVRERGWTEGRMGVDVSLEDERVGLWFERRDKENGERRS